MNGELLRVLAAEVVKTVHRASGDAQRLSGTDLDWLAVNRPGKDARDTLQHLLVCVVLVRRRRQLLPGGDEYFKYRHAAVGIVAREKEPDSYRTNLNVLFRGIDPGRALLHNRPPLNIFS
jgi:hypothetical protein